MEEKIYFKPEEYGKKKEKKPKREGESGGNHKIVKLIIFLLFITIIVFVIIWLLRGKTTISGQYPANIKNESVECISSNKVYEKVGEITAEDKELKISMVFRGSEQISTMALKYTLRFASENEAYSAEAILHARFGKTLAADGLDFEAFNNKFSLIGRELVVTLHVSNNTSNDIIHDYFLLERNRKLETLLDYRANYEANGFKCTSSMDNK